ncbi:MAG: HD domain-containing phosphohydrolase [Dehalococcoidales bacterium]
MIPACWQELRRRTLFLLLEPELLPASGAGIVKHVVNEKVVEIVEHHHDHYNGAGLHQVAIGEDIPLGARILTIADSFDAMTSDRPYRPAMPFEAARQEIKRCIGTQFDPVIANAFLKTDSSCFTFEKGKVAALKM